METTQPALRLGDMKPPKGKGRVWGKPFKKGVSGNPGGKPKAKESLAEIAREATPKAMRTLIAIMENEKASFAVRAYCADKVIDRAYGKPPQQNNVMIGTAQRSIRDLSDAELLEIIEQGRATPALSPPRAEDQPPIDVEPAVEIDAHAPRPRCRRP
jgi:Family of unknown function (DUF5681)